MNGTLIGIIILVIVLIVGPFATLRAVSRYQQRRRAPPAAKPAQDDGDDPDKPTGFW